MKFFKIMLLAFLFISIVSCSKDDDEPVQEEITINDFIGSWKASSAIYTNNSNTSEKFNFIENGGEIRFTMLAGGKVRTWIDLGTFSDEWDALATITNGNTLTATPAEASRGIRISKFEWNGNTLTLTNVNEKFDFTLQDDDAKVSATSVVVFQKN
jgi:hypothetical protein